MDFKQKTWLASAFAFAVTGAAEGLAADKEAKKNMAKCYNVVKAGKNDCDALDGSHSCPGLSTVDSSPVEWVLVPKGLCTKLVNGLTEEQAKEALKKS